MSVDRPDAAAAQRPEEALRRVLGREAPVWDSDRPAYDRDRLDALDALDALLAERDALLALEAVVRETHGEPERGQVSSCPECKTLIALEDVRRG